MSGFDPRNETDQQAMLLHMAAASVGEEDSRVRLESILRAALALVAREARKPPPVEVTPAVANALEGMAEGLANMAEHAELLAESANARLMTRPQS